MAASAVATLAYGKHRRTILAKGNLTFTAKGLELLAAVAYPKGCSPPARLRLHQALAKELQPFSFLVALKGLLPLAGGRGRKAANFVCKANLFFYLPLATKGKRTALPKARQGCSSSLRRKQRARLLLPRKSF